MRIIEFGHARNWRRASRLCSAVLNAVFFDLLPILLGIKVFSTLVSLYPTILA
jgi:hypothetical protein